METRDKLVGGLFAREDGGKDKTVARQEGGKFLPELLSTFNLGDGEIDVKIRLTSVPLQPEPRRVVRRVFRNKLPKLV